MTATQTRSIRVRPFQIGDLPQIAEIRNESIALSPDFYSMTVDRFRQAGDEQGMMSEILVAETSDEVVGYLHVYTDPALLSRGRINLDAIHVHPQHQRKGVGAKLLEEAIARGTEWGGRYLSIAIPARIEASQTFLLSHDFQLVRYFWKMLHTDLASLSDPRFPAGITTRTFIPGQDEGTLTELINACFANNWDFVPFTRQDLERWNAQSDFQPAGCSFALSQGREIGVATTLIDRQRLAQTHEDAARLFEFGVLPEFQGKGIGYQLLLTSAQFARKQGLSKLELVTDGHNHEAKHFYEHAGFQEKRAILVFHKSL